MSETMLVDTLLLSDMHIGLGEKNARWMLAILKLYCFKRIVLDGDTFHHFDVQRYTQDELDFFTWLFSLSPDIEIIIIPGNHDPKISWQFLWSLGLRYRRNVRIVRQGFFSWWDNGKKYLALHGHHGDSGLADEEFHAWATKWENRGRRVDRWLDWFFGRRQLILSYFRNRPEWLKAIKELSVRLMRLARRVKAHYIIGGHVHVASFWQPAVRLPKEGEVSPVYVNLGTSIDDVHTVGIATDGRFELHFYDSTPKFLGLVSY